MTADDLLQCVQTLNPGTLERARRLALAIAMLRGGMAHGYVRSIIRVRFEVDRIEAWRIVDMASDMAGEQKL
jgi:hypothetical protein